MSKKNAEPKRMGSALHDWYARLDSNQRPSESESDALSNCATGAFTVCYYTIPFKKMQPFFETSFKS